MSDNQLELRKKERGVNNDITTALKLKVTEVYDRKDVGHTKSIDDLISYVDLHKMR
jgi:hypothetical protein